MEVSQEDPRKFPEVPSILQIVVVLAIAKVSIAMALKAWWLKHTSNGMKTLRLKEKSMQETTVIANQTSTTYTPQIFRQLKSLKFRKRRRRKLSEDWDLITPHKKEGTVQGLLMLNKDKSIRCFGKNLQPTAMISLSPSRQRLCLQLKSSSLMKAILTGWHNQRIFKREGWQN